MSGVKSSSGGNTTIEGKTSLHRVIDRLRSKHYLPQGFPTLNAETLTSREAFIELCRSLASALEHGLASADRRPPFSWLDHELMCRCMLSCTDLEDAIGRAADFCQAVHPRGGRLSLELRGDSAFFWLDTRAGPESLASCVIDVLGLLGFQQLFGWLIGEPLRIRMILLANRDRENASPFIELFKAPILANQPCSGIEFDCAQLQRVIVRNAAELKMFLSVYPFYPTGGDPAPVRLSQQVVTYVETAIVEGRGAPDIAETAAYLAMSEATLRRRLKDEQTTFQQLKERCLYRLAEYYLKNTDSSIQRIARQLGFSNAASFRRAFSRWSATSPAKIRTLSR